MSFASVTILTFLSTITGVSSKPALVRSFWDVCKPSYAAAKEYRAVPDIITCDNVGSPRRLDYDGRTSCGEDYPYRGDLALAPLTTKQASEGLAQVTLATGDRDNNTQCCACYRLTLMAGPANGSVLVVQVVDVKRQDQVKNPVFALAVPGLTGYGNNCSSQYGDNDDADLRLGDGCQWQYEWLGSQNASVAMYENTECPLTLQYWSYCGRNRPQGPILTPDSTSTKSEDLSKLSKATIGISTIPLLISITALIIYCVRRQRKRAPKQPKSPKSPSSKRSWKEQIKWEKPELSAACFLEMGNRSIRELETTCIHEMGSIRTKISCTFREALTRTWNPRSIIQGSSESSPEPKALGRDV